MKKDESNFKEALEECLRKEPKQSEKQKLELKRLREKRESEKD